jgi:hypothetical protein
MAHHASDLPPYSEDNSFCRVNTIQPTAPQTPTAPQAPPVCPPTRYLVDEMIPFSVILEDAEKQICTYEIRSGSELIKVLNSLESSRDSFAIKFQHNINNGMTHRPQPDPFQWIKTTYTKTTPNREYNILKNFLTFEYTSLPPVECDCFIVFGYVLLEVHVMFWRTSLSLEDSIKLMKKLVPTNDSFYAPKRANAFINFYIGLSMIGSKYVCTEDYRSLTPVKACGVLENMKKLNALHITSV